MPRWSWKFARWRIIVVIVPLAAVVGLGVWASMPERLEPIPPIPNPNGYAELVSASRATTGTWPHQGDLDKADLAEIRPFLAANASVLARLREALKHEGRADFPDSQVGLGQIVGDIGEFRKLARLFLADARVALVDGRNRDAVGAIIDALELGQVATQGSLAIGASTGWMIQTLAIQRIRAVRDQLSADDCRELIRALERLEARREPLSAFSNRHRRWYAGAFPGYQRVIMAYSGMAKQGLAAEAKLVKQSRDQVERKFRFLEVELAIHAYHLDHGGWPKTLEQLVPGYLTAVPLDAATGKAIDYPTSPGGELTDDLANIGDPGTSAKK